MHPFFDSIIFLYLIASATLGLAILRDRKRLRTFESRHPQLAVTSALLLFFSFLAVFWGSFVEPRLITTNRIAIDLPNFEPARPVRTALISDIQVGNYKRHGWVRRVVKHIQKLNPDFVLMAGDIIQRNTEDTQYLSSFSILNSSFPTYAVLGDHDYHVRHKPPFGIDEELARTVEQALSQAGVRVLKNEAYTIEAGGTRLTLVGLDDWQAGKTDMEQAYDYLLTYSLTHLPTVVLVHNPDFILDPQAKNADLILAGNTHGGQVRLPLVGAVGRWYSHLPRSFDEGLFNIDDHTKLLITSGLGESGPRARLFNPPEIVLLELY